MPNRILVEQRPLDTRIALIEDNKLAEITFERNECDALAGNIYVGRVENVAPGMQAAFLNIGLDKNAFLHFSDLPEEKKNLSKPLRVGEEIPVQITKLPGGEKGVRVSGLVSLAGRMTVLMPGSPGIGVSKRIEDEKERKRLMKIAQRLVPDNMALIIRTNAENSTESEIEKDILSLLTLWETLKKRMAHVKAPACLYKDHDAVFRSVRDLVNSETQEILVEGKRAYASALENAKTFAPDVVSKIHAYEGEIPLFSVYSVEKQLQDALSRRVWLKSGGFLIFDKTEALTVIDVNTGKFVGKTSLGDTVFKLNLEAAEEIARQIRLRDLGGIIVIDFIDMQTRQQKDELVKALREFLKKDRTHTTVHGLTALGLVEMTRMKKREPIEAYLKAPCPLCRGEGRITSPEVVSMDVFSALERKLSVSPDKPLLVRVGYRVYEAALSFNPALSGRAYITPDDKLAGHEFLIEEAILSNLPPKSREITGE